MIFKFEAKLQRFRDYSAVLHIVLAFEKTFGCGFKSKKNFAIFRCCKGRKIAFTQADRAFRIKQFTNIVAEIDINALKI